MTESLPFTLPAYNIRDVERVVMSIKIDPYIKNKFQRAMKNSGSSTCGMVEPFLYGVAVAIEKGIPVVTSNLTLNLTVNRIVERERRTSRGRKNDVEVIKTGDRSDCVVCHNSAEWIITRWPSPLICQKEHLCTLHFNDFKRIFPTLGVERLAVMSSQDFGGD